MDGGSTPRIVVAVELMRLRESIRAVRRARDLADRGGAGLVVLVVWPPHVQSGRQLFGVLDALMRHAGKLAESEIVARTGDLYDVLRSVIARVRPSLVVVGASRNGATWAELATTVHVPILVARRSRTHGIVVAATDGSDATYPTLTGAVALAHDHASVEVFHLFDPWTEAMKRGLGDSVSVAFLVQLRQERIEALRRAAGRRSPRAAVVVENGHEPAAAVLEHCARKDPDLVVIGAHRAKMIHARRTRTAARLVDGLDRSVLVVPVQAS